MVWVLNKSREVCIFSTSCKTRMNSDSEGADADFGHGCESVVRYGYTRNESSAHLGLTRLNKKVSRSNFLQGLFQEPNSPPFPSILPLRHPHLVRSFTVPWKSNSTDSNREFTPFQTFTKLPSNFHMLRSASSFTIGTSRLFITLLKQRTRFPRDRCGDGEMGEEG